MYIQEYIQPFPDASHIISPPHHPYTYTNISSPQKHSFPQKNLNIKTTVGSRTLFRIGTSFPSMCPSMHHHEHQQCHCNNIHRTHHHHHLLQVFFSLVTTTVQSTKNKLSANSSTQQQSLKLGNEKDINQSKKQ